MAAVLTSLEPSGAFGADWNGSLTVTSDYVVRGITRSDGDPSLMADVHYRFGDGWLAGLSAGTARIASGGPISAELVPYAGYGRALGDQWRARITASHYEYPGSDYQDQYRYDELTLGVGWRKYLFADVAVLPDLSIESRYGSASGRPAAAFELAGHLPLSRGWAFDAGGGYYDLRDLVGAGYLYWNGGVSYDFGPVQFELAWMGTNSTAKSLFYDDRAGNRWAATLVWSVF